MRPTDKILICAVAILVSTILVGQMLLAVSPHYNSFNVEETGDRVDYFIDSSVYSEYSAVSINNVSTLSNFIVCYSSGYSWIVPDRQINASISSLKNSLNHWNVSLDVISVQETYELMNEQISNGDFDTGIVFLTGSLPYDLYNGKANNLLLDWLSKGGIMYWANGPLGKYISCDDGSTIISKFGDLLFFGESGVVGDHAENKYDLHFQDDGMAMILDMYFNECTFGINNTNLMNSLGFEFEYNSYRSTTLTKYHDGSGVIIVFGGTIYVDTASFMAKMMAMRMSYDSSITDFDTGSGKTIKGSLEIRDGLNTIILSLGIMERTSGESFTVFKPASP